MTHWKRQNNPYIKNVSMIKNMLKMSVEMMIYKYPQESITTHVTKTCYKEFLSIVLAGNLNWWDNIKLKYKACFLIQSLNSWETKKARCLPTLEIRIYDKIGEWETSSATIDTYNKRKFDSLGLLQVFCTGVVSLNELPLCHLVLQHTSGYTLP